jgi:hypothetical protein
LTRQNTTREQTPTSGLRQNVAGFIVATLMTVCTLGAKAEQLGNTCMTNSTSFFNDPLLVSNLNANFTPNNSTLLFDSGASVHCCPPGFGDEWPLLPLHGISPQLRSVSGDPVTAYGKRIVRLELDGHTCYLHFYVCDVYLPVVPVS